MNVQENNSAMVRTGISSASLNKCSTSVFFCEKSGTTACCVALWCKFKCTVSISDCVHIVYMYMSFNFYLWPGITQSDHTARIWEMAMKYNMENAPVCPHFDLAQYHFTYCTTALLW